MKPRPWHGAIRVFLMAVALLLMPAALLLGCSDTEGGTTDQGDRVAWIAPEVPRLPPPSLLRAEPLKLDLEQRIKQDEVDLYLAKRYQEQGWRILETTQTYVGDIVDWLDPASVPGSEEKPPPKPSPEELQSSPGTSLALTEYDVYPELRGPEGTVPVLRPNFLGYVLGKTDATSIEDFLTRYQVQGMPFGQDRLYEGIIRTAPNIGVSSIVSAFGGTIEDKTFTLLEMAVVNRGPNPRTTLEQIGIAISRDKVNFRDKYIDSLVRLQVEFMTMGDLTGDYKGGWDGLRKGFVPAAGSAYPTGAVIHTVSEIYGPQYENSLNIQLFGGNWWISFNGNWLGYYPGSLFHLINTSAAEALWYGEVYDPTPTDWTWTDMGSGVFSSFEFGFSAYFKNPMYIAPSGTSYWPDNANPVLPTAKPCYTRSNLRTAAAPWYRYFYLGGPGGDSPGCD